MRRLVAALVRTQECSTWDQSGDKSPHSKEAREHNLSVKIKTVISLLLLLASTGCIVVGGYSSESGWYIWPGTFVLVGIALLFFLLFRRRR